MNRGVAALQNGENALELLRLCAVGMRCAADQAGRRGTPEQARLDALAFGDHLARVAFNAVPEPPTAETTQLVALCKAERQRIRGEDTDALWNEVAAGWADLDRPYPAAYARRRQAAAAYARGDHEAARLPARDAYRAALELGAEPLSAEVARLAKRIGLSLTERPARATLPYQLSGAEFETLRYMAEGYDTRQIAKARGVAIRTVQTQQGKIYGKLGVHSGTEAVVRAFKEGLFG